MEFQIYKQTTLEGCLPICLLLLTKGTLTEQEELDLSIESIKTRISYALKTLDAFTEKYNYTIEVYVDNEIFLHELKQSFNSRNIELIPQSIDNNFISSISTPYILYIDHQVLGIYSHAPHFIIVTKKEDTDTFEIFDPWLGESKNINGATLNKAVDQLRGYLKYCPLLIKVIK